MFNGKVAVVTGAGSGIGAATARLMAERGARVVLVDRNAEGMAAVAGDIRKLGRDVREVAADVTDRAFAEREMAKLKQDWGRIDVLVTGAGVSSGTGTVLTQSEEVWERVWRINVMGTANWVKAVAPHMIEGGSGAIVTIASQLAFNSGGNSCAYIASKGAIVSFTKTTAVDLAKLKVRVNSVAPAVIDTPLSRGSAATSADPEKMRQWRLQRHPVGRIGEPNEVATAICYLASDEASFITGSVLLIDGGWTSA